MTDAPHLIGTSDCGPVECSIASLVAGAGDPSSGGAEAPLLLEAALWYARHGLPVFPLHGIVNGRCTCGETHCGTKSGKHPRTPHGFRDATTDPNEIRRWWTIFPQANIGLPTGSATGIIAVDVDPRNGGDVTFAALLARHGQYPLTAEQITGSGGRHVIFRYPGGALPSLLGAGIDLKHDGGYIVVPPSLHLSGKRYEWALPGGRSRLLGLSDAPPWVRTKASSASSATQGSADLTGSAITESIPVGRRNTTLTSLAGMFRRSGLCPAEILHALAEINRRRCNPPLPDRELSGIAESVGRYEPAASIFDARECEATHWADPIPLDGNALPDLPLDTLPGFLGAHAAAVAAATETPIELPALLDLAVVSTCSAGKYSVSPQSGYAEPVCVYVAAAMPSGNRKTAVLAAATAPLEEWECEQAEILAPERARAASARKTAEMKIERLRKEAALADGVEAAELQARIEQAERGLPVVPVLPKLWTNDVTPEQMAVIAHAQGGRIAILSDEGGIFDILAGRYSGGVPNIDFVLKGHAGSPVRVDRGSRPDLTIPRPALTLGLSPQPDVIRGLARKEGFRGRGLLARFIFALPPSRVGYRTLETVPVPQQVLADYRNGIRRLLTLTDAEGAPHVLALTPEALARWKEFQQAIETMMRDAEQLEHLRDWAGKLPGLALRIAGLFHIVQAERYRPEENLITEATMDRAVTVATVLIPHALAAFDLMDADPLLDDARAVVRWLKRERPNVFKARDCFCKLQAKFKDGGMDRLRKALKALEERCYIRLVQQQRSIGRPSELYEVNPLVLEVKP